MSDPSNRLRAAWHNLRKEIGSTGAAHKVRQTLSDIDMYRDLHDKYVLLQKKLHALHQEIIACYESKKRKSSS